MQRTWRALEEPGTEQLTLTPTEHGFLAEGHFAGTWNGEPAAGRYLLRLLPDWRVVRAEVAWQGRTLVLESDGNGHWSGPQGPLPDLSGCLDVDIAWTPFTNTLPIRRMGDSGETRAVYISPPDLLPRPAAQRYTCLGDGRWRYESLVSGYTSEIAVDEEGLVVEYPGVFTRTA